LFELVHLASRAFERVALYFENSISTADLPLLAASASTVDRAELASGKLVIESQRGVSVKWSGPAMVDGRLWPAADDARVLLPRGIHAIEATAKSAPLRLIDFNGELKSAAALSDGIELAYQSNARTFARFDHAISKVEIDGAVTKADLTGDVLILPRGQHIVIVH
jgi:hypothetical protein